MSHYSINFQKGFTLTEVIMAISVLMIGVVGVYIVFGSAVSSLPYISSRITAAYLAQEGVEIIRNIRDSNWIENENKSSVTVAWDDGLNEGEWQADYNDNQLRECFSPCSYNSDNLFFLRTEDNKFYNYDLGDNTPYKRKIIIEKDPSQPDMLKVKVIVQWKIKGKLQEIKAEDHLYNWY